MIQDMRYDFAEYISNEVKNKVGELNNQAESERFRNEQQTIEYYKSRIENYERNIDEWEQILDYTYYENTKERRRWEGAIRLAKANISQLEHEMEEHLNQINNDPKIGIESEIISINLINIL
jgi:chromosome segregation ATPase